MNQNEALPIADEVVNLLQPFCERIQIAGSLRRQKETVNDIEVLFIPKLVEDKGSDFFDYEPMDVAEKKINELLAVGYFKKRPNSKGVYAWGQKNKLAIHADSGIPIDLFSTTAECWWVSLVIRTGSKETNLRLTTGANRLGRTLNAYGCGVTESDGTVIPATSERHVFELCGVPYLEPTER